MVGSVKTEREGQKAGGTEGGRNRQGREVNKLLDGELEAGRVSEKRKECLNMQTMWDAHDFKHTIKHKLNLEGSKIQREGELTLTVNSPSQSPFVDGQASSVNLRANSNILHRKEHTICDVRTIVCTAALPAPLPSVSPYSTPASCKRSLLPRSVDSSCWRDSRPGAPGLCVADPPHVHANQPGTLAAAPEIPCTNPLHSSKLTHMHTFW